MSEEVKFNNEELEKLKNIQQKYFEIQNSLGQVAIGRINIHKQLSDLDNFEADLREKFELHRKTEKDFVDEITKKYGDGNLNVETGTFIPNKEKK